MPNRIAIRKPWSHSIIPWTTPLDRALCSLLGGLYHFNSEHAYLVGVENDLRRNSIILYIEHPEFPAVPLDCSCEEYNYQQAEARFPFLFHDTNPLLYRRF